MLRYDLYFFLYEGDLRYTPLGSGAIESPLELSREELVKLVKSRHKHFAINRVLVSREGNNNLMIDLELE